MSNQILSLAPQVTRNSTDTAPSPEKVWEMYDTSRQKSPNGNLLVLQWNDQNPIEIDTYIDSYMDLAELAKFVHTRFGNTQICLHRASDDTVMSWSSEEIVELATSWHI
jgi:hypothetical protein